MFIGRRQKRWLFAAIAVAIVAIGVGAYLALREPPVVKQMRETWPLSFENADSAVAVMQAVDTASLRSEKLRALHTLYLQQALYKQNLGHEDLTALDRYDTFFATRPDDREKMLYLYLHGESLASRRKYPEALRSFLQALNIAEESSDTKHEGRICRSIQNVYTKQMNSEMALRYAMRALDIFKKIYEADMYRWQLWHVAQCLFNTKEFNKSLEYVARAKKLAEDANDDYLIDYLNRISSIDYQKLGNPRKAVDYLQNLKYKEEPNDNYRLAEAYYALGDMDSATYYAEKVRETDESNIDIITLVALHDNDHKRANALIKQLLENEENLYQGLIKNNLAGIESEFHAAEAHNKSIKLERARILVLWIGSIFIIILIFSFIHNSRKAKALREKAEYYLLHTNLLNEKYEKLANDTERKIRELTISQAASTENNEQLTEQISKLTKEFKTYQLIGCEIGSRFETLNKLCESFFTNESEDGGNKISGNNKRILQGFKKTVNEFNSSPQKIKELEDIVDNWKDGLMSKFKLAYPDINNETKLLYLYKALNLPVITIAVLLNISQKQVHDRTNKLKTRIRKSGMADMDTFLTAFSNGSKK